MVAPVCLGENHENHCPGRLEMPRERRGDANPIHAALCRLLQRAEDLEQYQTAFKFPVSVSLVVRSSCYLIRLLQMADFENIKKTGWVTSRVDSIGLSAS